MIPVCGKSRGKLEAMDIFDVVDSRKACHWYLDKPVDLNIVRNLIAPAGRAASDGNLQPWNVHALTGEPLNKTRCAECAVGCIS